MYATVYFSLIFLISCSIFSISCVRPKRPPREYVEEYPDVRKIDITPRPLHKANFTLDSRVGNQLKRKDVINHSHSRVGNINPKPDNLDFGLGIDFVETSSTDVAKKSNTTKHNHNKNTKKKVKRVVRQSEDWEHPDCLNCLDDKYLKHYYAKGCEPIFEITCKKPCPKYFKCPKKQTKPPIEGCEYKGIIYNVSESIPNSNECLHCMCTDASKINCAVSECFGDWRPQKPNCYHFYEEGKCCSSSKCLTDEQFASVKTCSYDGKDYKYGEKIYPKEDSCISCICGEKWNESDPINSKACKRIECDFELESKWKDRKGCTPIYHPKTCCPVDYHCPSPKEWKCLFDDKYYEIGEKLDTKNDCIDCECRVPPDFTCVRKVCDSPPVEANCEPIYETNKCCPTYNCTFQQIERTDETNKTLLSDQIPPLVKMEPEPCPPFLPEGLHCAGTNCTTILDSNGCQACSCEKPCPELDCNYPCYVFAVTPGVCPKCSCS